MRIDCSLLFLREPSKKKLKYFVFCFHCAPNTNLLKKNKMSSGWFKSGRERGRGRHRWSSQSFPCWRNPGRRNFIVGKSQGRGMRNRYISGLHHYDLIFMSRFLSSERVKTCEDFRTLFPSICFHIYSFSRSKLNWRKRPFWGMQTCELHI